MKWTVLGCHSPYPAPGGATPGYLLEAGGKKILIDCGSGVLSQLAKFYPPYEVDAVLLSHLHHDHISDFFVLQYAVMIAMNQGKRSQPLPVWAPSEPGDWFKQLSYGHYIQKQAVQEGNVVRLGGVTIQFLGTDHPVPCYAMKITCGGQTILYGADSGPKTDWTKMGTKPDLFICEGSFLEADRPAATVSHLSVKEAAMAAKMIKAKRLLVTHLNPHSHSNEVIREAASVYPGPCFSAEPGLEINLSWNCPFPN
ncbi:MAG: MBL fold metallo-hydrolase [Thermoactinomyces sp.]